MSSAVIEARSAGKRFGRGAGAVEALQGLDLRVGAGRVCGLVGHNGAGKSTFIKMSLGFLRPTTGTIEVFSRPPGDPGAARRLGYLPEHPAFPEYLTGREVLDYVGRLLDLPAAERARRANALLEEVGIAHAADRRTRGYSKGMLQRLGLAQALLGDPELLILDEPMSGLDPIGRAQVKDILRRRREAGVAILFCSHILEDVERLCDDVVILVRGHKRFEGAVANVLAAGTPTWTALVERDAAPDLPGEWQPAGVRMWHARGLDAGEMRAVAAAAADAGGDLRLIRLDQELADLERLFLQYTREGTHAGEIHDVA